MWNELDRVTRQVWRRVGRPIDPEGEHVWLRAPESRGSVVSDQWLDVLAEDGRLSVDRGAADAGLLPDLAVLDGPAFRAADVHPLVREFYEHTSRFRMEAWSQWSAPFGLGGRLIASAFGRRVQQLALPVDPLAVSRGIDSQVVPVRAPTGEQVWAGWLPRLRSTGDILVSGAYRSARLPLADGPVVQVAFPLEAGSVQVFLTPAARADGALVLTSGGGPFGAAGAYVAVRARDGWHASRAPVHEVFEVYVDLEGVLRTDHALRIGPALALRLHYRMERH